MDKRLIIARFNEDLDWLKKYDDFKITVYNKGESLSDDKFFNVINLENKGRESHTWLYHIVKNYYHLDEINIFLQGEIDDLNCMAYKNPKKLFKKNQQIRIFSKQIWTSWAISLGLECKHQ